MFINSERYKINFISYDYIEICSDKIDVKIKYSLIENNYDIDYRLINGTEVNSKLAYLFKPSSIIKNIKEYIQSMFKICGYSIESLKERVLEKGQKKEVIIHIKNT